MSLENNVNSVIGKNNIDVKLLAHNIVKIAVSDPSKIKSGGSVIVGLFDKIPGLKEALAHEFSDQRGALISKISDCDPKALLAACSKLAKLDSETFSREKIIAKGIMTGKLSEVEAKKILQEELNCQSEYFDGVSAEKIFSSKKLIKNNKESFKESFVMADGDTTKISNNGKVSKDTESKFFAQGNKAKMNTIQENKYNTLIGRYCEELAQTSKKKTNVNQNAVQQNLFAHFSRNPLNATEAIKETNSKFNISINPDEKATNPFAFEDWLKLREIT